jgi:Zinc knuckle
MFISFTEKEPKFNRGLMSPTDFLRGFRTHASLSSLTTSETFKAFRLRLKGEALTWYDRMFPGFMNVYHSHENVMELYDLFLRTYEGTSLRASAMAQLGGRKHKPEESYEAYYSDVVFYAQQAGMDYAEDVLIHVIEAGLNTEDLRRMNERLPFPSMRQIFSLFQNWDATNRKVDTLHPDQARRKSESASAQPQSSQQARGAVAGALPAGMKLLMPQGAVTHGTSGAGSGQKIMIRKDYWDKMAEDAIAKRINQYPQGSQVQGRQGAVSSARTSTPQSPTQRQGATAQPRQGQQGQGDRRSYPSSYTHLIEEGNPPEGDTPQDSEPMDQEEYIEIYFQDGNEEIPMDIGVHTSEVSEGDEQGQEQTDQEDQQVLATYVEPGYQAGKGKPLIIPGAVPAQRVLGKTLTVPNVKLAYTQSTSGVQVPRMNNAVAAAPSGQQAGTVAIPQAAQNTTVQQSPPNAQPQAAMGETAVMMKALAELSQRFNDALTPLINDAETRQSKNGCYKCGHTTHYARECPFFQGDAQRCFNCDKAGHFQAQCKQPRRSRANTPVPEQKVTSSQASGSKNGMVPPQ